MKNTATKEYIQKVAEDTLGVIERDWGKPLDERLRRVLVHWLTEDMKVIRNLVLSEHRDDLEAIVSRIKTQFSL